MQRYRLENAGADADAGALIGKSSASAGLADFIARQEEYIHQLEKESNYCRVSLAVGAWRGLVHIWSRANVQDIIARQMHGHGGRGMTQIGLCGFLTPHDVTWC